MTDRYSILFILALLFGISCTEDENPDPVCNDPSNPDCPNYDPCFGKSEVSAEFICEAKLTDLAKYSHIYTTVNERVGYGTLRFTAAEKGAKYLWKVGVDTFQSRSFELRFSDINILPGTKIPITLMVTREVDTLCFPNDNGMDTLTREFEFLENCDFDLNGTYRGVFDSSPSDSFNITIEIFDATNAGFPCFNLRFDNLNGPNGDCTGYLNPNIFFNNTYALLIEAGQLINFCNSPIGTIKLNELSGEIEMELFLIHDKNENGTYIDDPRDSIPEIFTGYRLN